MERGIPPARRNTDVRIGELRLPAMREGRDEVIPVREQVMGNKKDEGLALVLAKK